MKTIIQTRFYFDENRTISKLNVPGIYTDLYVCEDTVRGDGDPKTVSEWKVKGKSAIPYGTYEVVWVKSPSRGVETLRLLNVPGFQGILVHSGNTEKDTEGCLLPGYSFNNYKGVFNSKDAVKKIEDTLVPLMKQGEKFQWQIVKGN